MATSPPLYRGESVVRKAALLLTAEPTIGVAFASWRLSAPGSPEPEAVLHNWSRGSGEGSPLVNG